MRSSWKVAVVVGLMAAPQLAAADEVQDQLLQMQERMSQLEEKLAATTDQLEATEQKAQEQQKLIQRAGLEERGASSGIASFFEQVEFGGWVAAGYVYNINDPANGSNFGGSTIGGAPNTGTFGLANPFHPDTNTFELNQLWFEMSKKATEDSRAGFGADIVMGKTADYLVGSSPGIAIDGTSLGNGNNVAVYQAYAEYLAPVGPGINVKVGRFATVVGAEVAQSVYNFNITRGLVYSVLQPINHVGLYVSSELDNGFDWGVGVANTSLQNRNSDFDNGKAAIWHLGYSQDNWGISFGGLWGGDNGSSAKTGGACLGGIPPTGGLCTNKDDVLLLNSVLTWDPSENLSTWMDVTYQNLYNTNAGNDPWAVGVALAGRLAITEATGFALRGEYIRSNDNFLWGALTQPGGTLSADQNLWSLTGTLDHSFTENLTAKGEIRYEEGDTNGPNNVFYFKGGSNIVTRRQVLLAAEMTYHF